MAHPKKQELKDTLERTKEQQADLRKRRDQWTKFQKDHKKRMKRINWFGYGLTIFWTAFLILMLLLTGDTKTVLLSALIYFGIMVVILDSKANSLQQRDSDQDSYQLLERYADAMMEGDKIIRKTEATIQLIEEQEEMGNVFPEEQNVEQILAEVIDELYVTHKERFVDWDNKTHRS